MRTPVSTLERPVSIGSDLLDFGETFVPSDEERLREQSMS